MSDHDDFDDDLTDESEMDDYDEFDDLEPDLNMADDPELAAHLNRKRRRFASVDIKLLRLALVAKENSPCQGLSVEWVPAQPSENLSPFKASDFLSLSPWTQVSKVKKRYRKLQLRYPPEQFSDKHLDWRPSADLLGDPTTRLNWYWQSGLVPGVEILQETVEEPPAQAKQESNSPSGHNLNLNLNLDFDLNWDEENPWGVIAEGLKKLC